MASRFSAARPRRAGEAFARVHHGEDRDDEGPTSKKVKFDVRNPSALAPSARDEDDDNDDVLAADVIASSGRATKRGAVNIDGYDSDSDNENFKARAEARRKKGKEAEDVDLAEVMDNYNSKVAADGGAAEDEEVDMFGNSDAEETVADTSKGAQKDKQVRFLADKEIEGQERNSKSGGKVKIDDKEPSDDEDEDDEEAVAAAIAEEGIDEEVGLGGLKKHAPKIDAFNMRDEQEEGAFDESGNFIRKALDADAVHDRWLEGISKKEMKKAAEAHEKREAELRKQQRENDSLLTGDLFKELIIRLEPGETALDALARLRKGQTKAKVKKLPKWKQKKSKSNGDGGSGGDAMDVDVPKEAEDPKQVKIRETINAIADAADKLMQRDYPTIYDRERERLIREYYNETGEAWVEPPEPDEAEEAGRIGAARMWEFRWTDGRDDAAKQGPFDGPTMKAWQDAGYFGEGVEFRPEGDEGGWTRVATFV
jgi:CD2 antigen cytoplasmic tail-binding protein 2